MGDTKVMRAVRTAVIRREVGPRLMVKKGVTTAHEGAEVVRTHPHLWEPIDVDFPVEGAELTDAAVEAAGTSHTEALRSLLNGLAERGFELAEDTPRDEVPAALVALALDAVDGFAVADGGQAPEPAAEAPGPDVSMPAPGDPGTHEIEDGDEPDGGDDQGDEPGETGGPGVMPADVVDPSTKEGRDAIRAWAREQDDEELRVADTGPIPQRVVDAWAAAQGGRS